MKRYVLFLIIVQLFIAIISTILYFDKSIIKLFLSYILLFLIYIPTLIEYFIKKSFSFKIHYTVALISLILFIILIEI